jgi:hypothetical protein
MGGVRELVSALSVEQIWSPTCTLLRTIETCRKRQQAAALQSVHGAQACGAK